MTTQNTRKIDNTTEDSYWQSQYQNENYYEAGSKYDDYQGAYRTGYEGYGRYDGKTFDQAENDLKNDWERAKGNTQMAWDKAKPCGQGCLAPRRTRHARRCGRRSSLIAGICKTRGKRAAARFLLVLDAAAYGGMRSGVVSCRC